MGTYLGLKVKFCGGPVWKWLSFILVEFFGPV